MGTGMVSEIRTRRRARHARQSSRHREFKVSREGIWIAVVAIIGIVAFVATLQVSIAGAFRTTRPQLSLKMAPLDAIARVRLASQLVTRDEHLADARSLAMDAIARDALQPGAFRIIAESLDGREPANLTTATALMAQSARLSRRDVATQMWLIEHYGRIGDAERMVRHFDIVLRASEAARRSGFPMLGLAASDPLGQELIIRTLSARPNWAKEFATFTIGSGSDLAFANRAAQLMLDTADPENRVHYLLLMRRLTEAGLYAQAWDLYGKPGLAVAGARELPLRNGGFEAAEDGSPFDWAFVQEPELWAAREQADAEEGLVLRLAASNGRSGELAWQLLHLPPGAHRIRLRMGNVPDDRYERPEILLTCLARSVSPLTKVVSPTAGTGPHQLEASFVVPPDCSFQRLVIRAAGDRALQDPAPWIDDIAID